MQEVYKCLFSYNTNCGHVNCLRYHVERQKAQQRDPFYNPATNNLAYEQAMSAQQEVVNRLAQNNRKEKAPMSQNVMPDEGKLIGLVKDLLSLEPQTKEVRCEPSEENNYNRFQNVPKRFDEIATLLHVRLNEKGDKLVIVLEDSKVDQLNRIKDRDERVASYGTPEK